MPLKPIDGASAGVVSRDGPAGAAQPVTSGAYSALTGYLAFYPGRVEACFLDDERVRAQAGDFYGGWITSRVVGPFKGEPGTLGW